VKSPLKEPSVSVKKKFEKKIQIKISKNFKFLFIEKVNNTEFDRYISNSKLLDDGENDLLKIDLNIIPASAISNTKNNKKVLKNALNHNSINLNTTYNFTEIFPLDITYIVNVVMYSCPFGYSGYSKLYKNLITDMSRNVTNQEYPFIRALYPYLSEIIDNNIQNNVSILYDNITTYEDVYMTCQTPINSLTAVQTDYQPSPYDSIRLSSDQIVLTDYTQKKELFFFENNLHYINSTDDNISKNITFGSTNSNINDNNTYVNKNHTHIIPKYLSINTKIEKLVKIKNNYYIDNKLFRKNESDFTDLPSTDLPSVLFGVNAHICIFICIDICIFMCMYHIHRSTCMYTF
jgi:hypothetical protein